MHLTQDTCSWLSQFLTLSFGQLNVFNTTESVRKLNSNRVNRVLPGNKARSFTVGKSPPSHLVLSYFCLGLIRHPLTLCIEQVKPIWDPLGQLWQHKYSKACLSDCTPGAWEVRVRFGGTASLCRAPDLPWTWCLTMMPHLAASSILRPTKTVQLFLNWSKSYLPLFFQISRKQNVLNTWVLTP